MPVPKLIKTMLVSAALLTLPAGIALAQQTSDTTNGRNAGATSTDDNSGHMAANWGWLGLVGLVGLVGLKGHKTSLTTDRTYGSTPASART